MSDLNSRAEAQSAALAPLKGNRGWFGRLLPAVGYSLKGLRAAWRNEAAFRQEVCLFAVLAPLTLALGLDGVTTGFLLLSMALVLAAELLNSALEAIVDKVSPERHELAGRAKDCGSAAVFVLFGVFAVNWLSLAGPRLWQLVAG